MGVTSHLLPFARVRKTSIRVGKKTRPYLLFRQKQGRKLKGRKEREFSIESYAKYPMVKERE